MTRIDVSKGNVYDMESVQASNIKGTGKKIIAAIGEKASAEATSKVKIDEKLNCRALEAQRKGVSTALKNIVAIDTKLADFSSKKTVESAAKLGESLFNACLVDAKNSVEHSKLKYEPAIEAITESAVIDVIENLNGKPADVTMDCVSAIMDAAIKHKMPKVEMVVSDKAGFKGFVENVGNSFKYTLENVKRFFQGVFAALFKSGKMATSNIINKILDKIDLIEDKNVKNCALSALTKYTDKKEVLEKIISKIYVPESLEELHAYESVCFNVLHNKHINGIDNGALVKFIDVTSEHAHSDSVLGLIAKNENSSAKALDNVIQNRNNNLPEEILADVAKHGKTAAKTLLAIVKYERPSFIAGPTVEILDKKISKDTLKLVVLNDNADAEVLLPAIAHKSVDAKCLKLIALSAKASSGCLEQVANHVATDQDTLMIIAKDERATTKALANIMKVHAGKMTEQLLVQIIKNKHIDHDVLKAVLENSKLGHTAIVAALDNCNKLLEDNKDLCDVLKAKISDLRSFDKLKLRVDLNNIQTEALYKLNSKAQAELTELTTKLLKYTNMVPKDKFEVLQANFANMQMQFDALVKKMESPALENQKILSDAVKAQQPKEVQNDNADSSKWIMKYHEKPANNVPAAASHSRINRDDSWEEVPVIEKNLNNAPTKVTNNPVKSVGKPVAPRTSSPAVASRSRTNRDDSWEEVSVIEKNLSNAPTKVTNNPVKSVGKPVAPRTSSPAVASRSRTNRDDSWEEVSVIEKTLGSNIGNASLRTQTSTVANQSIRSDGNLSPSALNVTPVVDKSMTPGNHIASLQGQLTIAKDNLEKEYNNLPRANWSAVKLTAHKENIEALEKKISNLTRQIIGLGATPSPKNKKK